VPSVYPRFSSEVNDILGRGNETVWPTLNTPHELARHVLTFRVHDSRPFRFVGSGRTAASLDGSVQQWVLDTERAMSSYSVMFVLLPAADTQYQEWVIDTVPVRALAYTGVNVAEAKNRLETWLPELRRRFGPFPALHGLSVFLYSDSGGGMEYYGGTITSLSALRHEVVHSYFGCSVVLRTYPDTWLDEAVTQWFEQIMRGVTNQPLSTTYRGNWVGARSPVSVGFSTLAYSDGASIMQDIANRLGGTDRMTDFLRTVVQGRTFAPFTTLDFVGDLAAFSGIDLRSQFVTWLYDAREPALFQTATSKAYADEKTLDLNPSWTTRSRR
jgi:aminopeptidase N